MVKFLNRDKIWKMQPEIAGTQHAYLPGLNYVMNLDENGALVLEEVGEFEQPDKLFGTIRKDVDRILYTFDDRPSTTGVLLSGEKGSGKTLLAKMVSKIAADRYNIPTILVNAAYCGDQFNNFVQSIEQPAILLFDEFEKVYRDKDRQNAILTLLDGTFPTKKLFIMTVNDGYGVTQHMHNRPGRIYYHYEFSSVPHDFIREYAEDQLKPELLHHVEPLLVLTKAFYKFNFDMLKAIVEEMNRFDETPDEALKYLNVKPEYNRVYKMEAVVHVGSVDVSGAVITDKEHALNPLVDNCGFCFNLRKLKRALDLSYELQDDDDDKCSFYVTPRDLVDVNVFERVFKWKRTVPVENTDLVFSVTMSEVQQTNALSFLNYPKSLLKKEDLEYDFL